MRRCVGLHYSRETCNDDSVRDERMQFCEAYIRPVQYSVIMAYRYIWQKQHNFGFLLYKHPRHYMNRPSFLFLVKATILLGSVRFVVHKVFPLTVHCIFYTRQYAESSRKTFG